MGKENQYPSSDRETQAHNIGSRQEANRSRSASEMGEGEGAAEEDFLGPDRMGRIDAASLAYERSVLATNPAAAREHSSICDSITNWCLAAWNNSTQSD
jgi:hypothetical protein